MKMVLGISAMVGLALTLVSSFVSSPAAAQNSCPQGKMSWSSCMSAWKPGYQTQPNSAERRQRCERQKTNGCITG
jgi:hypothetical protein